MSEAEVQPTTWRCKCGTDNFLSSYSCAWCGHSDIAEQVSMELASLETYLGGSAEAILFSINKDFYEHFRDQVDLFEEAKYHGKSTEIFIHADAMFRGIARAKAIFDQERKIINFSTAAAQYGFGPHPGRPPDHRGGYFKTWYKRYLSSEDWAKRRKLVMIRCHQICEGCAENPASEVHHKTYDHVGYEFLFELVGLCKDCHERFHKK